MARVIALCFLVLLSLAAFADTLTGKVVKITDGDTIYVLDANYEQHKIRLAGIDAPERKQAYGLASRKHLASIVTGQQVTVEEQLQKTYAILEEINRKSEAQDRRRKKETESTASPIYRYKSLRIYVLVDLRW